MTRRAETGAFGESLAASYLSERGYTIRERNWRHGHGELDIVAQRGDVLVFVEVRARRGDSYGTPEETLDTHKQSTLIRTAQAYLQAQGLDDAQWQIDVIAIDLDQRNTVLRLDHLEAAISQP